MARRWWLTDTIFGINTVSALIRRSRLERGLTQRQLAKKAGTSQPAIARLETGTHSPTIETLERVLAALGLELELRTEEIDTGVDRTLIVQNLRMSPQERLRKLGQFVRGIGRMRQGMHKRQ